MFYEDVEPRITKLHEERAKVFELQKLEGELAHKLRLFEAWEYHIAEMRTTVSEEKIKTVEQDMQNIKDKIQENLDNVKKLEEEAENVMKETENVCLLIISRFIIY